MMRLNPNASYLTTTSRCNAGPPGQEFSHDRRARAAIFSDPPTPSGQANHPRVDAINASSRNLRRCPE